MTWHIVPLLGRTDTYEPIMAPEDKALLVPFGISDHTDSIHSDVAEKLSRYGLEPGPPAQELLRAAMAAYTADLRVPRKSRKAEAGAFDNWTRDICLHLPVNDVNSWEKAAPDFQRLLRFLTGDHWTVVIRHAPQDYVITPAPQPRNAIRLTTDTAALFSGGLDSYIGAVDELSQKHQIILVGHHAAGGGPTSSSQTRAITTLREAYPEERSPFIRCWVSPPKGKSRSSEITTRGRSIIFLGLGITVASALEKGRLIIPENGLISLNVPLTGARAGSLSTRTTHPHLIDLMRNVLRELGIAVSLELPYRFSTKGEMLASCADSELAMRGIRATMSCSHPGAGRYTQLRDPNIHCGYCIPCIIRRASIVRAGITDPTVYAYPDLKETAELRQKKPTSVRDSDLRSLRLALDRFDNRPPSMVDILLPGPLPGSDNDLRQYLEMFVRGIQEVQSFVDANIQ